MVAICERRRYPHAALLTLHHGAHAFTPDDAALPEKPLVADKKGMCNRRNGPATGSSDLPSGNHLVEPE